MTMKGFTLIETMVAVSILTLAIAGPLTTASRAIVASQIAGEQLTASYLAQEGIEYVRMMRDDEYIHYYAANDPTASADAWNDFITAGTNTSSIKGCVSPLTCLLDPVERGMGTGSGFALQPCSGNSCTPLYLASGLYTQRSDLGGAVVTPYTRTVTAVTVSATEESIVSTVSWSFHSQAYSVTVTDQLTPWQ